MAVGRFMYFDDDGSYTDYVEKKVNNILPNLPVSVTWSDKSLYSVKMPYLMAMRRSNYIKIGGYDEDFIGYAGDDNDFVDRLLMDGVKYYYTDALYTHLYHGDTSSGYPLPDNEAWLYNKRLYDERKGTLVRNKNKEWGKI